MAITITCIRHSHSALKIPSWEAIIINTEYMDHSHELFSSLFTIICHLSCHRSARNLCSPPITRQQTQNRRRVKCSPTWSLALRLTDRTLLLVILPIRFGEIFYCSSSSSTLKVWPITWNETFTGDRTCVSCSILSQKCVTVNTLNIQKYPMQSSINALCTLHIYMGWVLRGERGLSGIYLMSFYLYKIYSELWMRMQQKGRAENICNLRQCHAPH